MTFEQVQNSEYVEESASTAVETIQDRRQQSRESIQVLPGRGLNPDNLAAYITLAQSICKSDNIMLRPELRSSIPVMLGLLDIAQRSRLSIYMLAMKCYVQKGVLCFESQVFHALARPFLDGGLKPEYVGDDQDRVLIVRGRLKYDPYEYEHRSPPLGKVHPGHTVKEVNGERIQFVRGSPLWDRKPDMQLWYDTTRDWVRKFCPEAVMGVYTVDEVMDENFIDQTPRPSLGERLAVSSRPELREGFRPADVATSLEQASVVDTVGEEMAEAPIQHEHTLEEIKQALEAPPAQRKVRKRPGKPAKAVKAKAKGKPPAPVKPPQRPAPAQREAREPGSEDPASRYIDQAEAWIKAATDPNAAAERWDAEYDDRNVAEVPIEDRNRLLALLDEKYEQLRKTE